MTTMANILIFPILLLLVIILAQVFLALWTYNDAKNRNLNPIMWTLIVLLVPNLIGLLIYFLVGRNQPAVICGTCHSKVPSNAKYCLSCGNEISNIDFVERKSGKKYIIAFIISMAIIILIGIVFAVKIFTDNIDSSMGSTFMGPYSIGCAETNLGDKWKVSFVESTDTFTKSITIDEDGPKTLNIESSSNQGTTYLSLYRDGRELDMITLPYNSEDIELDLTQYGNGKIRFELSNTEAKHLKFIGTFE